MALGILLVVAAFHNFLVFHVLAELFACVVGIVLFVVVVSTRRLTRSAFLLWLGCGYFWTAMVDLIHTLAYKGMHVFPGDDANLPTQLWVAARAVQTVTLLLAPLFLSRPLSTPVAFGGLGALAVGQGVLIAMGFYPDAFIDGMGLTAFKVGAEFAMVALLAAAALFLRHRRALLDAAVRRLVTASIGLTAASELSFTLYVDVYGVFNALGHILKFGAFWAIYLAIVRTTLTEPFRVLARAASTYDAVPDPTVLVGPDARIVQANRATTEEFRMPVTQLIGTPVHDLLHPWGVDADHCPDCAALQSGRPLPQREVFQPLTGHTYLVTFTPMAAAESGGEPAGTIVVMRDITARRRAEDWVRTHAERLAMALDNGELGLWDWNVQTGTVYFSPNMELMLGYPVGSWERHVSAWESLVHPDDRAQVNATLTAHLEGLTPIYECEHRVRRADGTWAWILDKGKVVERDGEGQPVRAVGTHTDISVLKRQQEDLRDKSRRLEESNRDLEQFAYVASHDLQEPLRMVAGYLSLVRRRYADRLDDNGREFISLAVDGAARMSRLISDLLEYSRVSTRAQDMQAVPAAAAVTRALSNLGAAIAEAGAEVAVADLLPVVRGDPAQVERLFQNLIGNAVKYRAPDHAPVITVGVEPGGPSGFASFVVADNGIGIAPEDQERIFQIFTRLHGRTDYEGTGIGLAVCKRIIDRHGGSIAVRSALGAGAAFVFTLPLSEDAAPGVAPAAADTASV